MYILVSIYLRWKSKFSFRDFTLSSRVIPMFTSRVTHK